MSRSSDKHILLSFNAGIMYWSCGYSCEFPSHRGEVGSRVSIMSSAIGQMAARAAQAQQRCSATSLRNIKPTMHPRQLHAFAAQSLSMNLHIPSPNSLLPSHSSLCCLNKEKHSIAARGQHISQALFHPESSARPAQDNRAARVRGPLVVSAPFVLLKLVY